MRVIHSEQYNVACIVAEPGDTATDIMLECLEHGALRNDDPDGTEFCVQLRDDVGPELWTKSALLRTKSLSGGMR